MAPLDLLPVTLGTALPIVVAYIDRAPLRFPPNVKRFVTLLYIVITWLGAFVAIAIGKTVLLVDASWVVPLAVCIILLLTLLHRVLTKAADSFANTALFLFGLFFLVVCLQIYVATAGAHVLQLERASGVEIVSVEARRNDGNKVSVPVGPTWFSLYGGVFSAAQVENVLEIEIAYRVGSGEATPSLSITRDDLEQLADTRGLGTVYVVKIAQ